MKNNNNNNKLSSVYLNVVECHIGRAFHGIDF